MANFTAVSGIATVATAGTAIQMVATTAAFRYVREVVIKADPDNGTPVWVGNDNAGDVTVSNGFQLQPGDSISFSIDKSKADGDERIDLSSFWVDDAASSGIIHWIALTG